jgi:FAD/FMN-containing dehydrogenase
MTTPSSVADAVTHLASTVSGQLLKKGDSGYDEARKVHNGLVDKRPALIVRCCGVADIVDAVAFARDQELEVSVRGGGHNVAGRATIDGGLMIDLSLMKGVHVDANARTVRAEGGVTWGQFNRDTQVHGLASTGGIVSSTGVAGLTLGGGLGYLMGKYGLAVDNLVSVEIVTADGRVVTVSEDKHPDLFWGIRGGGGNFGVAVSFEFRLHPVGPTTTGGIVAHLFDKARDVLRFYRDVTASVADEFTVYAGVINAPDGSGTKLAAVLLCHCGSLRDGDAAVRPIKQFGSPVLDVIGPMPYCQVNAMLDADYPRGALNYWKSSFLAELGDEAIDAMIDCFARCPTSMRGSGVVLEHVHGAATRVGVGDTAFPHRRDGYSLLVLAQWMDPAQSERCIAWARESFAAMKPFMAEGGYVNYLDDDETKERVTAAYGPNYRRLQEVKRKYDPDNFFHMNQNINPVS